MKSWMVTVCYAVAAIELIASGPAVSMPAPKLSGTFGLVVEQCDDISGAIDQAVAPMSIVMRPFARRRLRTINTPYQRLRIESMPDAIVIVADPRAPIRTPANGAPVRWRREDGESFNVSGTWDGRVFEQTFVSGTGRRVNQYTVSPDGQTLTIRVEVTGGGLGGAMTYRLVYRRISS